MLINDVRRATLLAGIIILLGVSLILAACGGAASSPTEVVSPPTEQVIEPTATLEDTPVVTEEPNAPTAPTEETEVAETEVAETEEAACQPTDPNVDPIAGAIMFLDEYLDAGQPDAGIAAVNNADWSKGPANAPVTLIEYGDFQ